MAHTFYVRSVGQATLAEAATVPSTAIFFIAVFAAIVLVGLLTGFELPLLMDAANDTKEKKSVTNRVLAIDYVGSLVGTVVFALVLVPRFEVSWIALGVAVLNVSVAVGVMLLQDRRMLIRLSAVAIIGISFVSVGSSMEDINQYFLKQYYYYVDIAFDGRDTFDSTSAYPDIERNKTPYQLIDLVKDYQPDIISLVTEAYSTKYQKEKNYPRDGYTLYLNGDFQTATTTEEVYHEWFAHVPVMAEGEVPQRVLLLGGGDGFLLREILKYDDVESITHVDLDKGLVDLVSTHPVLKAANKNAFEDPRVNTLFTDGLQYVRNSDEQYDAIYIDFPNAVDYNLSKLYSQEFYTYVYERLADNGYVVYDATGSAYFFVDQNGILQVDRDITEWPRYYQTMRAAGFETVLPYITQFEQYNKKAAKALDEYDVFHPQPELKGQLSKKEKQEANAIEREQIANMLFEFSINMQQGFLYAKKEPTEYDIADMPYTEFDITRHVLNKKRYKLAFNFPQFNQVLGDESYRNTTINPTFPNLPVWFVRLAY
jgi:spermidine synthase